LTRPRSIDNAPQLETITPRIATVRGQRVVIDADLAALYGVPTKRFNEAVKRNLAKFPTDFMFVLAAAEAAALWSQFATSNAESNRRGGRRYALRVFTEHGALMAATILNSPRAVDVAIYVVRAFVRLRESAATHGDLAHRLDGLEAKTEALAESHHSVSRHTQAQLKQVFDALRALMAPPETPRRPIGFVMPKDAGDKKASKQRA
jgi:hypothetical protein